MGDSVGAPRPVSAKSPEVLVPILGLVVSAGVFLVLAVSAGTIGFFSIILIVFSLAFLGVAALVWRRGRAGFIASIAISVLFLLLFGSSVPSALTGFADFGTFLTVIIITPALGMAIIYSILGLRVAWRKGGSSRPGRMIPFSATLALLTAGFVVGGAVIGGLASGAVLSIGKSSNARADIIIVVGASNGGVSQPFSPGNFTMKAGSTVTWVNKDTVTHSVTSTSVPSGASPFDSGNLPYGNTYSITLTVAGTYHYYCSIHPSMTGIIIVTP